MKTVFIENLRLFQYKNYAEENFVFTPGINAIVGKNGIGKTNLLDAIYTLSFTKSYFSKQESLSVQHNCNACSLKGNYAFGNEALTIDFFIRDKNKKEIIVNQQAIKKYSDFIGTVPIVMISPDDVDLINGIAEPRRHFLDKFIAQINHHYLASLINYYKILQQKNALLKEWHHQKSPSLLSIYNEQLEPLANIIFKYRTSITQKLFDDTKSFYDLFSHATDKIELRYESQFHTQTWQSLVSQYTEKECLVQRSLIGIQKDDLVFSLNPYLFKEVASQGQKKSLLLAIKLATLKMIAEEKNITPILLLDDIFEKLDNERLAQFFKVVFSFPNVQTFLTDTNRIRVQDTFERMQKACHLITIDKTKNQSS